MNMLNLKSIKTQLILFLGCFALFIAVKDKDPAFLFTTLIAVIFASAIEALISYLKTRTLRIGESAVITGLIAGYVISSDEVWWKPALVCSLAILSKHLVRFQKKHIFNPAAFGIFTAILFFGIAAQWKATYLWYVLAPLGIYFAHRLRKTEVLIGYAVVSCVLFGTQALLSKVPLGNISGYFSYFYIFVMIIEPKTSPSKPLGKYVFGTGIAVLIFIFTEAGVKFDAELLSLLLMNAAVPLLNKVSSKRGGLV